MRNFPSGPPPELPPRQSIAATQPQNGFRPPRTRNITPPEEPSVIEPETVYPNLLQELALDLPPGLFEPDVQPKPLPQIDHAPLIEESECDDLYQTREEILVPIEDEENSRKPRRPPSIKSPPPALLLNGSVSTRPELDLLDWEPHETQTIMEQDDVANDDEVFEDSRSEVQLVQKRSVEMKPMQIITLQKKLGDGYFGDVWTGKCNYFF